MASQAQVELAGGIPFISDKDLQAALDEAKVPAQTASSSERAGVERLTRPPCPSRRYAVTPDPRRICFAAGEQWGSSSRGGPLG